ncbi:MAG: cation transporter, partial [Pseudonocardia sp.]|nr:cation transporter [Pseudonocardia sp.]
PALAATRYLLRRARSAPGSTDRPGGHSGAERNELGLTHDEDAGQIVDALDEPAAAEDENQAPAARQWGRLGLLRTAAIAAPVVALFTASQLGLGLVSGASAVLVDALDNVFGLLPGLLGLFTLRAARGAVDRFTARLIGLVMVTTGVDLFTSRILEPDHLTSSPWLLIAAGGLNVAGAGVLAWLYSRVRSATAEAGVAQTLADAVSSVSVVGAGIAALLGVPEGLADQVATLAGATLIVFMGVGVITDREVNLLAPITTLRGIPGSLRALAGMAMRAVLALAAGVWPLLRAPAGALSRAATSDIGWVAQAARMRVEHRLSRIFRRDGEVALALDDDRLAGLGELAEVLSDSERFAVHGDRVINVFAVWTHASALADGTIDPAGLDPADYAALRRHAAITAVAEGLAVWQAARLVGVPTRVLRGWLNPSIPTMPRRRGWQRAHDGWARIPAGVPGGGAAARLDLWRLLSWVWLERNHGVRGLLTDDPATPGVSAGELTDLIARGAPGTPAWAQTAAVHLRGLGLDVAAELALLARNGLLVGERRGGVERYRPGGELGRLLARAPPAARAALLRNPAHTVEADFTTSTPAEQAQKIHSWLRETVRAWGAAGRGALNRPWRLLGL